MFIFHRGQMSYLIQLENTHFYFQLFFFGFCQGNKEEFWLLSIVFFCVFVFFPSCADCRWYQAFSRDGVWQFTDERQPVRCQNTPTKVSLRFALFRPLPLNDVMDILFLSFSENLLCHYAIDEVAWLTHFFFWPLTNSNGVFCNVYAVL